MNLLVGAFIFAVLFAIVLVAISVGYRFLETQRKKQVESMLDVASGRAADERHPSILIDERAEDPVQQFWHDAPVMHDLTRFIQQSGLSWTVTRLVLITTILAVAGGVLGFVLNPLGIVSLSVIGVALLLGMQPSLYLRIKRAKRLREFEAELPEALDFLARSMRAGHAFSISLEMLGSESPDPLGLEFRTLFNELNLGAPFDVALANFSARVPILDIRMFVSSVLLQKQTGGNLSEILVRLAYVIRERFRLKGQVRAASAHGRMTAIILSVMPIVMIFALLFVAPGYLQGMAHDPDGKYMIGGAIIAQILGYLIMRRIVDIKV